MSTFNKALIAALVVQVALALVIRAGSGESEGIRNPEPLLGGFDKDQVTRIAIFDPATAGGSDDAEGAEGAEGAEAGEGAAEPAIDLRREASGSEVTWKLVSHHGHQAKTAEVDGLLDKLAGLRSRGPAVTSKVRHKQLGVAADDYRRKLVIETGAGVTTLYVGAPAGSRQVSVRVEGSDEVHQVGGLSAAGVSSRPASWIDPTYLNLPRDEVAYLSVRNQAGVFEMQRNATGGWSLLQNGQPYPVPAGKKFNVMAMGSWLNAATRINMTAPGDPGRTVDTPLATITLRMKSKEQQEAETADGSQQETEAADAGPQQETETQAAETADASSSQAPEEYILEVAAEGDDAYYVRLLGSAQAAVVKNTSTLRALVDMSENTVLIPAEN